MEDSFGGGRGGWLGAMKKELSSSALPVEDRLEKEASGVSGMAGLDVDDEGTGVLLSQSAAGLFPGAAGVSGT